MALRAIGAELPAMNVGMTVGALRTNILEDHAGVALSTSHVRVHTL